MDTIFLTKEQKEAFEAEYKWQVFNLPKVDLETLPCGASVFTPFHFSRMRIKGDCLEVQILVCGGLLNSKKLYDSLDQKLKDIIKRSIKITDLNVNQITLSWGSVDPDITPCPVYRWPKCSLESVEFTNDNLKENSPLKTWYRIMDEIAKDKDAPVSFVGNDKLTPLSLNKSNDSCTLSLSVKGWIARDWVSGKITHLNDEYQARKLIETAAEAVIGLKCSVEFIMNHD